MSGRERLQVAETNLRRAGFDYVRQTRPFHAEPGLVLHVPTPRQDAAVEVLRIVREADPHAQAIL